MDLVSPPSSLIYLPPFWKNDPLIWFLGTVWLTSSKTIKTHVLLPSNMISHLLTWRIFLMFMPIVSVSNNSLINWRTLEHQSVVTAWSFNKCLDCLIRTVGLSPWFARETICLHFFKLAPCSPWRNPTWKKWTTLALPCHFTPPFHETQMIPHSSAPTVFRTTAQVLSITAIFKLVLEGVDSAVVLDLIVLDPLVLHGNQTS